MRCLCVVFLIACASPKADLDTGGVGLDTGEPTDTAEPDGDGDGDGWPGSEDCDDGDSSINPGAEEVCDGVDNNCDGSIDEGVLLALFVDGDGDGHGDAESPTEACSLAEGLSEWGDDCDDSEPLASPSQEEVCNDLIDNDCDGTSNDCAPSGALSEEDALFGVTGVGAYDALGWEVAGSPDLDGDGRGEVLIGALYGGTGDSDFAGAAYRISTMPSGVSSIADAAVVSVTSAESYDYLGTAVRGGVDLTGDGVADWVASAPGDIVSHNGAVNSDRGEVFVFSGDLAGEVDARESAAATIVGHSDGIHAGYAVDLGIVDDAPALLLGAHHDSSGETLGGAAYLMAGPLSGTLSLEDADAVLVGDDPYKLLGVSVALQDLDGDGAPEMIAGGPSLFWEDDDETIKASRAGVLAWVSEPDGTVVLSDADGVLRGSEDDRMGYTFSVGDVDADGYMDVAVGAYTANNDLGGAYLFAGPLSAGITLDDAAATFVGEGVNEEVGSSLDISADLDGDGHADLLVGAWGWPEAAADGRAYLLPGPLEGSLDVSRARAVWSGSETGQAAFGFPIRYVPDVNGDQITDIVVGACYDGRVADYAGAAWVLPGSGL